MDMLQTLLPSPEDALEDRTNNTMTLRRITVTALPCKVVQTTLFQQYAGDAFPTPLWADLYTIDDDSVRGYIPTKSLFGCNNHLEMVFFVSPSLPPQVRPFGEGKTHVLVFDVPNECAISYDIEKRILLDQQVNPATGIVYYIVVFGDKQYTDIIIEEQHGII